MEVTFFPPEMERPSAAAAVEAARRFAVGVYEDPKALGGLAGLSLESGGWTALVKAELHLIMLEEKAALSVAPQLGSPASSP